MKDYIGVCPLSGQENGCYYLPINETNYAYKSLVYGYESNDLMIEGEFDFERLEETLPNLYKDVKIVDEDKKVWYPQTVNIPEKGMVFIIGTSVDDWEWAGIKSTLVKEEEKEKFKHPKTGEYIKYKSDPSTMKKFQRTGFVDALDYIGALDL